MAGLGIYRNYKRIKNEQEILNPAPTASMGQVNQQPVEQPKFTPEDKQRYDELRRIIAEKQSQLSQEKTNQDGK